MVALVVLGGCSSDINALDPEQFQPFEPNVYVAEPEPTGDPTEVPWSHVYPVDDDPDPSEKANIVQLHAWAVQSHVVQQGGTSFYAPDDLQYTSLLDAASAIRGRCGRFDGVCDATPQGCNEWMACASFWGRDGAKTRKWAIDWSGCPLDATLRSDFLIGARRAFVAAGWDNEWDFTETTVTDNPNIVIQCGEYDLLRANNAVAAGVPWLNLEFAHQAPVWAQDQCEEPGDEGSWWYHLVDGYWAYRRGRIFVHWFDYHTFVNGCGLQIGLIGLQNMRRNSAQHLIMHELGHILGFQHQSDINTPNNVMHKTRDCHRWANPPHEYRLYMRNTLDRHDFPDNDADPNEPLNFWDEDLSCYSPL